MDSSTQCILKGVYVESKCDRHTLVKKQRNETEVPNKEFIRLLRSVNRHLGRRRPAAPESGRLVDGKAAQGAPFLKVGHTGRVARLDGPEGGVVDV